MDDKLMEFLKQKELEYYELANSDAFEDSTKEYYGGSCDAIKEVLDFIEENKSR